MADAAGTTGRVSHRAHQCSCLLSGLDHWNEKSLSPDIEKQLDGVGIAASEA